MSTPGCKGVSNGSDTAVKMLNGTDSLFRHRLQDVQLILLSVLALPLTTFALFVTLAIDRFRQHSALDIRRNQLASPEWRPRTILVTGVGMTKGLTLARLFYQAGHNVIGADFESHGALVCGRVSKSLSKFYSLRRPDKDAGVKPYSDDLLRIVAAEKVHLWVSCSGVASALEDGMIKERMGTETACKAIQFDVSTTQLLHEKDSFIQHAKDLGLKVPQTYKVTSLAAAESLLARARLDGKHKFLLKPTGVQDADRADMTLLPKGSHTDTISYLSRKHFSADSSWILQQFISGPEYCTHALVVDGQVKAFAACPSAELLMHYEALPTDSKLTQAMLEFTTTFASHHGKGFTGHLSFDFMMESDGSIYPIECNPRAHTAVVLFSDTPQLVDAYLSALEDAGVEDSGVKANELSDQHIQPDGDQKYYWVGHDVIELALAPLLSALTTLQLNRKLPSDLSRLLEHILWWRDGTFVSWDPAPWWWLYHVYWPMQFLHALSAGKKWSRVNVSTTKVFEC